MDNFIEIKPEDLKENPFKLIGKDWMLITAAQNGKVNTMTASWGGFGTMWGKNVTFIVIRPQRYTKEFVDGSSTFSLTFFNPEYKEKLAYIGKTSGREEDKIDNSNLTIVYEGETPYFHEANIAMICEKIYIQPYESQCFLDKELEKKWYPQKDYHSLYIAEVKKILIKK